MRVTAAPNPPYVLVQTYLGMEKPFAVDSAFTVRLLDSSIKMDASKVRK